MYNTHLLLSLSLFLSLSQVNKQYTANDLEAFMKIAANWQSTNHNLLEGVDLKTGKRPFSQRILHKQYD